MKLNILKIIPDTIVDGPHIRSSIYVSGCSHKCPGCHNPESWKFGTGEDYNLQDIVDLVKEYGHRYVTISGGDPFYQSQGCYELCKLLRLEIPEINIWGYTGYTLEFLNNLNIFDFRYKLLNELDGIVDGPFIESLKSDKFLFRGSSNQRIFIKIDKIWKLYNDS